MTNFATSKSSRSVMVELSPVVPSTRMASVPFSRWKLTRRSSASQSTDLSSLKGVTRATIDPVRLVMSMGFSFSEQGFVCVRALRASSAEGLHSSGERRAAIMCAPRVSHDPSPPSRRCRWVADLHPALGMRG